MRHWFSFASEDYTLTSINGLRSIALAVLSMLPGGLRAQQYVISTFAGGGFAAMPAAGTNFTIGNPGDLTLDAAGNVYFVSLNCAFKLDSNDILTRLASTTLPIPHSQGDPGGIVTTEA